MESDWCICGLLECKMFVKPPPVNEPFGESFVTTTDGARTRRGLNMADTSLSRVISHKHTPKAAAVLLHTNQILTNCYSRWANSHIMTHTAITSRLSLNYSPIEK